jgi:hypothetical protein
MKAVITTPVMDESTTSVAAIGKPQPVPGQVAIDIAYAGRQLPRRHGPQGRFCASVWPYIRTWGSWTLFAQWAAVCTAYGSASASRRSSGRWHDRGHGSSSRRDRRIAGRAVRDSSIGATLTRLGLPTSASGSSWETPPGDWRRCTDPGHSKPIPPTQAQIRQTSYCVTVIAASRRPTPPDRTHKPTCHHPVLRWSPTIQYEIALPLRRISCTEICVR